VTCFNSESAAIKTTGRLDLLLRKGRRELNKPKMATREMETEEN
jgi:hypothetical protein